jgi:hypothetical protein
MNLDKYRVPESARLGVWIELPDSDGARFRVRLPSEQNRAWQRRMLSLMVAAGAVPKPDGTVDRSAVDVNRMVEWTEQRLLAFHELCVVECPPGIAHESLLDEYRPALEALFDAAMARVAAEDGEAADAEGKSLP